MASPAATPNSNSFIARNSNKQSILFAIAPTIGLINVLYDYKGTIIWYNKSPFGCISLLLIISTLSIYFWIQFFDKSVKLEISREGLWSNKDNLTTWENIEAFYVEIRMGKAASKHLFWVIYPNGQQLEIDITNLDKTYEQIVEAIIMNSHGYSIRNSGINTIRS